jgi:hypothetical protein
MRLSLYLHTTSNPAECRIYKHGRIAFCEDNVGKKRNAKSKTTVVGRGEARDGLIAAPSLDDIEVCWNGYV